jgi:ketol-acid reductoisomerase
MARINFGGVEEEVVTREEFPLEKAREVLKNETVAVLGYGVQGPAQALNMRDNGINVIVGQKSGSSSWDKAVNDGWVPGETLFSLEEAAERGTMIQYLVSDAGQVAMWPKVCACSKGRRAVLLARLFHRLQRPDRCGAARQRRCHSGRAQGLGHQRARQLPCGQRHQQQLRRPQDFTGRAKERTLAVASPSARAICSRPRSSEVHSDLTGERGVLMGALAGIMEAQYNTLRKPRAQPQRSLQRNGRRTDPEPDPPGRTERHGLDVRQLLSTTAQRGALDWRHPFRDAVAPVFHRLYESVVSGEETRIVLEANSAPDYRESWKENCATMRESEMWQAGAAVSSLRPENWNSRLVNGNWRLVITTYQSNYQIPISPHEQF